MNSSSSSSYLFIIATAPYATIKGQEQLELALTAASLDQKVSLLFLGPGVWHLTGSQEGPLCGRKTYTALLKALPHYDINTVYVSEQDFNMQGLAHSDLLIPVLLRGDQAIATLIHQHTHIIHCL